MKTVNCEGVDYLAHEADGNAARWIMPLAQYYCKGAWGLDIGCFKLEWKFPNAIPVDHFLFNEFDKNDAMDLPTSATGWDYIFSSHCLEHVKENWMNVLDYWLSKIKVGGILFLYLPHASQNYWQPRNNRKHIHSFHGPEIDVYLKGLGHQVFVSGVDANHSFTVICEKREKSEPLLKKGDGIKTRVNLPEYGVPDSNCDVLMPGCFDKSSINPKTILHAHLNMTDEQREQALKDGEKLFKSLNELGYIRPEIKPIGKCEIHESRWFEQNTEDLANKIADMRMESEAKEATAKPDFKHRTYMETEHEVWFNFNIERQKLNLSPIKPSDYVKLIGR